MPSLTFSLSLAALLFAPGPTNALLALSGAEAGAWRALRLLPIVIIAYGLSVVPLAALGGGLLQQSHALRSAVTLAAALWVAWMAYALWHRPAAGEPASGAAHGVRLFITTLLNPKAFVIGLVLIPGQDQAAGALALFFALLAASAVCWVVLGAGLRARAMGSLPLLRRLCAGWLGLIALMLGSAALSS